MEFNEYDGIDDNEYDEDYGLDEYYGSEDYRDDRPDCDGCNIHKAEYWVHMYDGRFLMCGDCVDVHSKRAKNADDQKQLKFSVMDQL